MLQKAEINPLSLIYMQRVKKVVSNSPGLVDFAIGLVINLPHGQVLFFGGNRVWGLVEMTCGLVYASYSLPEGRL